MSDREKLVTIAAKVPTPLREAFAELAKRRRLTPSRLLRALVERELAGGTVGDQAGEVESAVVAELTERGEDLGSARAAAAVNLARRMDRDPTSGAANAAQLRVLLAELSPQHRESTFDPLSWIALSRQFRKRGWQVVDGEGHAFTLTEVAADVRADIIRQVG